jgi:PilZ domain-containing protein
VPPAFALLLPAVARPAGERAVRRLMDIAARASGVEWCAGLCASGAGAQAVEDLAGAALLALRRARRDGGVSGPVAERRRHRRAVRPPVEARVEESGTSAELLDLSISGARVRSGEPLPGDRQVSLWIRGPAPRAREARVRGRVMRRGEDAGRETAVLIFDDAGEATPDLVALLAGLPMLDREGRA